jgi:hypothetical protein
LWDYPDGFHVRALGCPFADGNTVGVFIVFPKGTMRQDANGRMIFPGYRTPDVLGG